MTTPSLRDGWQTPGGDSPTVVSRDFGSLVALLVVAGTVLMTGSVRGLALAAPFLLVAIPTPSPVAFAAGQLAILPTLTLEDTLTASVAQLVLLVVLVEPARTRGAAYAVGATLVAYVGLVGLFIVTLPYGGFIAGGLLCLAVACGTYLARRVTLVRLGLVSDDEEPGGEETDGVDTGNEEATDEEPGNQETGGNPPTDRSIIESKE